MFFKAQREHHIFAEKGQGKGGRMHYKGHLSYLEGHAS